MHVICFGRYKLLLSLGMDKIICASLDPLFFFLDYHLVSEKTACNVTAIQECPRSDTEQCANSCRNVSSMFVFGCDGYKNCGCACLLGAVNGSCKQMRDNFVDLYRYSSRMTTTPKSIEPVDESPSEFNLSYLVAHFQQNIDEYLL